MQLNISGHHVEVTPALKSYITEKMERIQRHFNNIIHVNITLSVEPKKKQQKAEADLNLSGGKTGNKIYADHTSNDMYASIDKLVDKLDRQVLKYKEKIKAHEGKK